MSMDSPRQLLAGRWSSSSLLGRLGVGPSFQHNIFICAFGFCLRSQLHAPVHAPIRNDTDSFHARLLTLFRLKWLPEIVIHICGFCGSKDHQCVHAEMAKCSIVRCFCANRDWASITFDESSRREACEKWSGTKLPGSVRKLSSGSFSCSVCAPRSCQTGERVNPYC
jgi:hypothetical protein